MTDDFTGDIDIVLDLRGYKPAVTEAKDFGALWDQLEPALLGRDLSERPAFYLDTPSDGSVGIQIARLRPGGVGPVRPETRFNVVAVRERPRLRYRCRVCAGQGTGTYGPFVCPECRQAGQDDRICDEHVVVLAGALTSTCPEHRPGCAHQGCPAPATFRCAGNRCRSRTAWCDAHRRGHPRNPDLDYCPSCYDVHFPVCEEPSCRGVGTVACEYVLEKATGRQCGRRSCTRHAHRWQVYGGERVGLGLCRQHRAQHGMTADDVLTQIVVASAVRRPAMRPPSLAGFAHNLRNADHRRLAVDYPAINARLAKLYAELKGTKVRMRDADRHLAAWKRQVEAETSASAEGERILERLRMLVRQYDRRYGEPIAESLRLVQYKAATAQRPGLLFVDVAEDLRGLFAGKGRKHLMAYSDQLGLQVRLEGGGGRR
ncbi:hypothetical protein SAMN05443665_104151 [Actinomadura meyerae]|uniref:Uncharacterized protein n=1 Tax=Actinomadura meyerae TaxID=240840 RepID=A0A239NH15_9ACTN|nr:hypothetical protein [Actinomadura meyerae]SNT54176.1 hypothetical protein SAMN05443665_104151 [Actinomadura meyerae]